MATANSFLLVAFLKISDEANGVPPQFVWGRDRSWQAIGQLAPNPAYTTTLGALDPKDPTYETQYIRTPNPAYDPAVGLNGTVNKYLSTWDAASIADAYNNADFYLLTDFTSQQLHSQAAVIQGSALNYTVELRPALVTVDPSADYPAI